MNNLQIIKEKQDDIYEVIEALEREVRYDDGYPVLQFPEVDNDTVTEIFKIVKAEHLLTEKLLHCDTHIEYEYPMSENEELDYNWHFGVNLKKTTNTQLKAIIDKLWDLIEE